MGAVELISRSFVGSHATGSRRRNTQKELERAEKQVTMRKRLAAHYLAGVTSETAAGHSARFDQFNAGQRKKLIKAVVQAVAVEGSARAWVRYVLPTAQPGDSDQGFEGDPADRSSYGRVVAQTGFESPVRRDSVPRPWIIQLRRRHPLL